MRNRSVNGIALLVISVLAVTARAEVSVDVVDNSVNSLILGTIIEDPDPLGVAWQPFRAIPIERILNPAGHARGDGRPDLVYERIAGGGPMLDRPVVTWSWKTGADHDIAIAEWDGTGWSAAEFLTATADDDLDPRLFIEPDGTRHVVWWTAGPVDTVLHRTRPVGSSVWSAPIAVANGGRRPAIVVFEGTVRMVYERTSAIPGMAQDMVVIRQDAGGFIEEFVASTQRTERLDAILHVRGTHLWVDWKQANDRFGCAEFSSGTWGAVDEPSWTDPSWIGVESVRKSIAAEIAAP